MVVKTFVKCKSTNLITNITIETEHVVMEPENTAAHVAKQWHEIARNKLEAYSESNFSKTKTTIETYDEKKHFKSVVVSTRQESGGPSSETLPTEPHLTRQKLKLLIQRDFEGLNRFCKTFNLDLPNLIRFLKAPTVPPSRTLKHYCSFLGIEIDQLSAMRMKDFS